MDRPRARRLLRWTGVVVALAVVCAAALLVYVGRPGSTTLEGWIGEEVARIANRYLQPQVSFTDLDYQYPLTIRLKDFQLKAPDDPGKSLDVLGAESATITLAQIPRIGQPIRIQNIVLDKPVIRAVATHAGSGQFIGLSHLVRQEDATRPSAAKIRRLSDDFQIRLLQIEDGQIIYDPRIPGTRPMELDHINTKLTVIPVQAGSYELHVAVRRKPVFDLSVAGRLNLDTLAVENAAVALKTDLNQKNLSFLPPELQSVLARYQVRGNLDANVTGSCRLADAQDGQFVVRTRLADANVALAPYRIPLQSLDIIAHSDAGHVVAYTVNLHALGGEANLTGRSILDDSLTSELQLDLSRMRIEDLLLSAGPTDLAGVLSIGAHVDAPLRDVLAHLSPTIRPAAGAAMARLPKQWGAGTVALTDARLVKIPLIDKLEQLVGGGSPQARPANERVTFWFHLSGNDLQLHDISYHGPVLMAEGNGTVGLDQRLNLLLGGGPSDSAVGLTVSGTVSRVSDAVAKYHVTGTASDPLIGVELSSPARQTVAKTEDTVQNGAEQIGQGLEQAGQGILAAFKKR